MKRRDLLVVMYATPLLILTAVSSCAPKLSTVTFYFLKIFFLMWTIHKVFIEGVTILFLFYIWGFLAKRCVGSQLPDQGSNPHPLY